MGKILIIKNADFSEVSVDKVTPISGVQITALASPIEGGVVSGSGTYQDGDNVILTATPNKYYYFDGWDDGVYTAVRTVAVSTSSMTYTANFVYKRGNTLIEDWTIGKSFSGTFSDLIDDERYAIYKEFTTGESEITMSNPDNNTYFLIIRLYNDSGTDVDSTIQINDGQTVTIPQNKKMRICVKNPDNSNMTEEFLQSFVDVFYLQQ